MFVSSVISTTKSAGSLCVLRRTYHSISLGNTDNIMHLSYQLRVWLYQPGLVAFVTWEIRIHIFILTVLGHMDKNTDESSTCSCPMRGWNSQPSDWGDIASNQFRKSSAPMTMIDHFGQNVILTLSNHFLKKQCKHDRGFYGDYQLCTVSCVLLWLYFWNIELLDWCDWLATYM